MTKIKKFFRIMKYELIRVSRNKMILSMLLGFSILLLLILSMMNVGTNNLPIGIYTDGLKLDEITVLEVLTEEIDKDDLIVIDSIEKGLEKVNSNEICFFITIEVPEQGTEKEKVTFYYDGASAVGRTIKDSISTVKNQYSYEATKAFLEKYGITVNEAYFDLLTFEKANHTEVTIKQLPFAMEVACCVSIIIMFGLAYSISRDNETQVAKNLSYIPMGVNRYLFSKIIPYILLGIVEIFVLYLIGWLAFRIDYQINVLLLVIFSTFFVVATAMLGLLFSCCKSQLSTVFLDMVAILLPLFTLTMAYIQSFPIFVQILLYAFPISSFISFINTLMYSGIIVWWKLAVFIVQAIAYYLIAYFIIKKRVRE